MPGRLRALSNRELRRMANFIFSGAVKVEKLISRDIVGTLLYKATPILVISMLDRFPVLPLTLLTRAILLIRLTSADIEWCWRIVISSNSLVVAEPRRFFRIYRIEDCSIVRPN